MNDEKTLEEKLIELLNMILTLCSDITSSGSAYTKAELEAILKISARQKKKFDELVKNAEEADRELVSSFKITFKAQLECLVKLITQLHQQAVSVGSDIKVAEVKKPQARKSGVSYYKPALPKLPVTDRPIHPGFSDADFTVGPEVEVRRLY